MPLGVGILVFFPITSVAHSKTLPSQQSLNSWKNECLVGQLGVKQAYYSHVHADGLVKLNS